MTIVQPALAPPRIRSTAAPDGSLIRKSGVMAVVIEGGEVAAGDAIEVLALPEERLPLEPV